MNLEALSCNHWIRAATLAQAVLSQSLSDERLDQLRRPTPVTQVPAVRAA